MRKKKKKEQETERSVTPTRMVITWVITLCLFFGVVQFFLHIEPKEDWFEDWIEDGGGEVETTKDKYIERQDDSVLNVYMFGDSVYNTNDDYEFFTTSFTLGEFSGLQRIWGEEGHMYYEPVQEFQKQTGVEVNIQFFIATTDILTQLSKDLEAGTGPDVIIGSIASENYDLLPYMEEGYFYDLTPFFEEDEILSGGDYVTPIMEAGQFHEQQLIFPLTFNMNLLMTSEENLQKNHFPISRDYTYNELVKTFIDAWSDSDRDADELLMLQYSDMWNTFPYDFFSVASGRELKDINTKQLILDQKTFEDWAMLFEAYLEDDYSMTRAELKSLVAINNQHLDYKPSKTLAATNKATRKILGHFDFLHNQAVCITDGGMASFHLHSFAAQASYYESRFSDQGEEFLCIGVPMQQDPDYYAAQVTTFGAVTSDSNHAKEGYQFLKFLADSPRFMHFDLSVNKEQIDSTFDDLTSTYFDFYPAMGNFPPEDVPEGQDWLGDAYTIQPMTSATRDYLQSMIDHIGAVSLPNRERWKIIQEEIERYIYGDVNTLDEAYANVQDRFK